MAIPEGFTLSSEDKQRIASYERGIGSVVHSYILHKERLAFEVDDVLIKYVKGYVDDYTPIVETVSKHSKVPKKYVVVHKDKLGISYVKQLSVKGDRIGPLICTAHTILTESWYAGDPDSAENILLGDDMGDPLERYKAEKEKRKAIKAANSASREKTGTPLQVQRLMSSLKPGDKFYLSGNKLTCEEVEEFEVITVIERKVNTSTSVYYSNQYNKTIAPLYTKSITITAKDMVKGHNVAFYEHNFWGCNVWLTKPQSVYENL